MNGPWLHEALAEVGRESVFHDFSCFFLLNSMLPSIMDLDIFHSC